MKIKNPTFLFLLVFCLAILSNPAQSKMRTKNKVRAGTPPYKVIADILTINSKTVKDKASKPSEFAPHLTWLTDSSPEIRPELISNNNIQMYTIRNFGNQLELAAGAVDYGVRHLLTPVLLITANSDNQAVRLFMEGYAELSPALRRELDHLHLALTHDNKKEDFKERLITNIEANIDYQVDLAIARYHDRVRGGRVVVVGSILDVSNVYGHGAGRLIIINLNGERKTAKLRRMQTLKSITPNLVKFSVGRTRKLSAKIGKKTGSSKK